MSTEGDEGLNSEAIDGDRPTFVAEVDATVFEAFLDSLTPIVDEARFRLHAGGITVRAVDAVNVACVESELHLDPDVHPVDTAIGVRLADLETLFEGLPRASNEDVTIEISEESLTLATDRADVRLDTIDESKLRDGDSR